MTIEKVRDHCLKKPGVTESFPFGGETLVFKVFGKIFCLGGLTPPFTINLKCDPELALELREKFDGVTPGYHMNKTHWNTIALNSNIKETEILGWVDHSYDLVFNSLPMKLRNNLSGNK